MQNCQNKTDISYPMQARYNRKGSVDDAANFVGVMPSQASDDRVNWIGNDLFNDSRLEMSYSVERLIFT